MNYYIEGNPDKAEQIKAAFEKLGYNTGHLAFTSSQLYYTIEGKVELMCTKALQNLIKAHPDYKELELPVELNFKVGDWVVKEDGTTFYGGNYAEQITLIEVDKRGKRIWLSSTTWVNDDEIRLWTISDAKDGDILATDNGWTCIFQAFDGCGFSSYCFMDSQRWFCESGSEVHTPDSRINGKIHPATKEQRDLFFKKMREARYQWDADKKELRKIKHYAIADFHAGMPVLVRDENDRQWIYTTYSHHDFSRGYKFMTSACEGFVQCIPYEGNKHLLGTTDMCDEQYINW